MELSKLLRTILLAATLCSQANADELQTYQSLPELRDFVSSFLQTQIGSSSSQKVVINVAQLDPRLRLFACPKEQLEAYLPHNVTAPKASLVGVRCGSDKPWQVIVQVQIQILETAAVTKHALSQGQKITPDDIILHEVDINRLSGYFNSVDQLSNKMVTHSLNAGQAITPQDLKSESLVLRGDSVSITAQNEGINIAMPGLAMQNGALGEIITIRNASSNRLIQAKVVGNKAVQVVF